ncbi:MAG: histidine kinase [Desulfitobacterium sp.]|nr:histidine kinase [Desulfitobacterium sp.]
MVNEAIEKRQLQLRLTELRDKLADLKARWPAHSLKPSLIMELEELEEEIEIIEEKLIRMV